MVSTNDLKSGMAVDLPEGLFQIIEHQHVKPGKGKAFVRTKLKNLETGAVVDRTFRAGEDLPQAIIDRQDHQFLYRDDLGLHFMDAATFEQVSVPTELVGEAANYLVEGMIVQISKHEGNPIGIDLSASVELKVTHAEPAIKGDRVSGATKPVTVETGFVVQAPLFVDEGDVIKVDTRTGTYITRIT
jgi:elongation factor P